MNKTRKSFFNSISFKSWLYFMLFALSIVLILLISQIIMFEPFYRNTLKKNIISLNQQIYNITFSEMEEEAKSSALFNLTADNNACILIYNRDNSTASAYDVLGEYGCAIYSEGNVNPVVIESMDAAEDDTFYIDGRLLELSDREVMVYGQKYNVNDTNYYIISNIALQSMDLIIKTTQNQFLIIVAVVLFLAILISIVFSRLLAKPIMQIQQEAVKLSEGNYNDVHFEKSDFNEVDELSETLDMAAKELSKVDETRKELFANVSHDLKTPLTMIKAYAEMIRDISGSKKAKRNEHLDVIINETDNLNKLVSDMLDLSKLQDGVASFNFGPFDLSTNILESVNKFNTMVQKEGINIQIDCEPELVAYGDESKINEVLYNFISNALKHCGDDKLIIIRAFLVNKTTIRVEIEDHGPGIDENMLPYIWDRYYKNDKKYTRAQSGSGLGLAINKAILEDHKSKYGVNTEVGKGSTFYFELSSAIID
ncbi:MAG: HAMP domain-containing histidine kinase [Erysipelotrichaceae bacterium]|nr:HAMP domain-containing histidine kinase [Erysipelotrichaceae bacterium]